MPYPQFDRNRLEFRPLKERPNKQQIERDHIHIGMPVPEMPAAAEAAVRECAARMRRARENDRPIIMAFGAHTIKNGLGPVLIRFLEDGWLQHLATNGAGIIHDWEFAFQGASSEDVRANVAAGCFGIWEETGFNLNLALLLGAYDGLGYGEAVGRLIAAQEHVIPAREELLEVAGAAGGGVDEAERAAAAADVLAVIERQQIDSGIISVPHPWRQYSVQAAAYRLGIPFTGHPMIGHDIIYTHPVNHGAAIGRAAQRDFLSYARAVSQLDSGVYLSVGSAVMSPMIFEKSLSMTRNVALREGRAFDNHYMLVVDLAASSWDWSQGEPPQDRAEYYLRYCKSFSRMGGTMRYLTADNRDFLLLLAAELGIEP